MDHILIASIIALVSFLVGYLFAKLYFQTSIRRHRAQAITQSVSVHKGFQNEKLAPLLPWFPYKSRDMTFIGKGIDYLVFDGLSEWYVRQVVLLEIKSGKSQQNTNEKLIEQAIQGGRVRYEIKRI